MLQHDGILYFPSAVTYPYSSRRRSLLRSKTWTICNCLVTYPYSSRRRSLLPASRLRAWDWLVTYPYSSRRRSLLLEYLGFSGYLTTTSSLSPYSRERAGLRPHKWVTKTITVTYVGQPNQLTHPQNHSLMRKKCFLPPKRQVFLSRQRTTWIH